MTTADDPVSPSPPTDARALIASLEAMTLGTSAHTLAGDLWRNLHRRVDDLKQDAERYRDAYEVLGAAFTESAALLYGEQARRAALEDARLVRVYGPSDVVCYEYWANAGASVTLGPSGARVVTPTTAWHYAAGVPLDYSGVDFASEDCWVRVRIGGVSGQIGVALYDANRDDIAGQHMVDATTGVLDVALRVECPSAALLILRTGQHEGAAEVTFVGAEIVAAPRPPAAQAAPPEGAPDAPTVPRSWRNSGPGTVLRGAARAARSVPHRLAMRLFRSAAPRILSWSPRLDRRVLRPLARAAGWWRAHIGVPRTLWGVTPILTLPLLARADRLLGLRSSSFVYTTYATTSQFDVNLKRLMDWVAAHQPDWLDRVQTLVLHLSLARFDVYHYFCDRGLSPHKRLGLNEPELKMLRGAGKRLYAYAYGADIRTRKRTLALGVHNLCVTCPKPTQLCICDDDRGARNQQMIAQYANATVTMGDMVAYAPQSRNQPYWPLDTRKVRYVGVDWTPERPLRVAHAPNHPYFKGTNHLLDAIARLQAEGRSIELIRIQGVPNTEVVRLFEQSDIIADQFVAGSHGYTALEAMASGKPVLCYLRDPTMVLEPDSCPMINTWPESIYRTLSDCLDGRYDLSALGLRSRNYIEHAYSIEAVAVRLGRMYLETARFPERINRRIRSRMTRLADSLPPLIQAPPPVPWAETPGAHIPSVRSREAA